MTDTPNKTEETGVTQEAVKAAQEAVTLTPDGKLSVDIGKADAIWNALDPLTRAEMTNMIFEPVLEKCKAQTEEIERLRKRVKAAEKLAAQFEIALDELDEYNVTLSGENYNCTEHNTARADYRKAVEGGE